MQKKPPFRTARTSGPGGTMEDHSVLGPKQEYRRTLTEDPMSSCQYVLHVKTRAAANHIHTEATKALLFRAASLVFKALLVHIAADWERGVLGFVLSGKKLSPSQEPRKYLGRTL